jgi:hypothetical protein
LSFPIDYTNLYGLSGQYKGIELFTVGANYTFPKTKYVTVEFTYTDGRNVDTFVLQKIYKFSLGVRYWLGSRTGSATRVPADSPIIEYFLGCNVSQPDRRRCTWRVPAIGEDRIIGDVDPAVRKPAGGATRTLCSSMDQRI